MMISASRLLLSTIVTLLITSWWKLPSSPTTTWNNANQLPVAVVTAFSVGCFLSHHRPNHQPTQHRHHEEGSSSSLLPFSVLLRTLDNARTNRRRWNMLTSRSQPSSSPSSSGGSSSTITALQQSSSQNDEVLDSITVLLDDRFSRWRYLQDLLEGDDDSEETNRILYLVLDGALKYRRPRNGGVTNNHDDGSGGAGDFDDLDDGLSTELYEEDMPVVVRQKMQQLVDEFSDVGSIDVLSSSLSDYDEDTLSLDQMTTMLQRLEELLPDPAEDEDAHKSLWDLVMELHGRESVKLNETQGDGPEKISWKLRCATARLILHHDFLTLGIVTEPLV